MSENRISVEDLKRTIDAIYLPEVHTTWHGLQIEIKKHLSMNETINFVESAVSLCFAADTNEFIPEIKDYAIRRMIIEEYTNIDLPEDTDEQFDLLYSSDLIPFISESIESAHFEPMLEAIDRKLRYLSDSHASEMLDQVDQVMTGFENLEKSMSDLFGGVDGETIMQIAGAVAGGGFDVEKLAQATFALNNAKDGEE